MSAAPLAVMICGHGRMGQVVAEVLRTRGHQVAGFVSRTGPGDHRDLGQALAGRPIDAVIDFTRAETIESVVAACLEARVPLVTGTTGWNARIEAIMGQVREARGTMLAAPNFSIGVQLFLRAASATSRIVATAGGYDLAVEERHHRLKADAPSGTALALARAALAETPTKRIILHGDPAGVVAPDALHVSSLRCGTEFGRHTLLFDGEDDFIELRHTARSRRGFAVGAVRAAEWLIGKTGVFTIDDLLDDLAS